MRGRRTFIVVLLALFNTSGASSGFDTAFADGKGWTSQSQPTALSVQEERSPAVAVLAKRYNPAMAFPTRDLWPTSVSYAWHDGTNLMGRVVAKTGKVVQEYIAFANTALQTQAWGDLPNQDQNGNRIDYFIDAPGDDRDAQSPSSWLHRWREIMEQTGDQQDVTQATYPPTQYAHLFWFNREKGLLGIQYWFYYPFNNWINRHEGDWEHINIILQGPKVLTHDAEFTPVGYQFFFHGKMHEPKNVIKVAGANPRDEHVMVFAGGLSRFIFWQGSYSGGSYALPARYPGAGDGVGPMSPADDTRKTKRFIHARDFDVVVLPEPHRLDMAKNPELSWLKLSFYAGQHKVFSNPFIIDWLDRGGPPQQPGRKRDWNAMHAAHLWEKSPTLRKKSLQLPAGWRVLKSPSETAARQDAAKKPVKRPASLNAQRYLPTDWH